MRRRSKRSANTPPKGRKTIEGKNDQGETGRRVRRLVGVDPQRERGEAATDAGYKLADPDDDEAPE